MGFFYPLKPNAKTGILQYSAFQWVHYIEGTGHHLINTGWYILSGHADTVKPVPGRDRVSREETNSKFMAQHKDLPKHYEQCSYSSVQLEWKGADRGGGKTGDEDLIEVCRKRKLWVG